MNSYGISAGNVVDGFRFWGPWSDEDAAVAWADAQPWDDGIWDWVVITLEEPTDG